MALSPNELRRGNWINSSQRNFVIVSEIRDGALRTKRPNESSQSDWFASNTHTAIPLTPEILEACGFERNGSVSEIREVYQLSFDTRIFYQFDKRGNSGLYFCDKPLPVLYLHQVQNAIFALIGLELIINLPANQSA